MKGTGLLVSGKFVEETNLGVAQAFFTPKLY